jgi:hypothetical protein
MTAVHGKHPAWFTRCGWLRGRGLGGVCVCVWLLRTWTSPAVAELGAKALKIMQRSFASLLMQPRSHTIPYAYALYASRPAPLPEMTRHLMGLRTEWSLRPFP